MPAADQYAWLPIADVAAQIARQGDPGDDVTLEAARVGAAAYVERVRPDLVVRDEAGDPASFAATDDVKLGALILAARFYARKGSPMGVATFAEFGAAQIVRLDPDVERLLGLGRHARPRIG